MGVRTTIVPVSLLWFLTFPTFPHAFTNAGNAASTLNGITIFELFRWAQEDFKKFKLPRRLPFPGPLVPFPGGA